MGDEDVLVFPEVLQMAPEILGDPDKVILRCQGRRFTVHLDRIRASLPRVITAYTRDPWAAGMAQDDIFRDLPLPIILEEHLPRLERGGSVFDTSQPMAWYEGRFGCFKKRIRIFAHQLLECEKRSQSGWVRDERLRALPLEERFAFVVAHELRHWIQDITGWERASLPRACASWFLRRFFRAPVSLALFFLSLSIFGVIAPAAWKFIPIDHTVGTNLFLFVFSLLLAVIVFCKMAIAADGRTGWVYRLCRFIDKKYIQLKYKTLPTERDADEFGFSAMRDPEWLSVVSIEKT